MGMAVLLALVIGVVWIAVLMVQFIALLSTFTVINEHSPKESTIQSGLRHHSAARYTSAD